MAPRKRHRSTDPQIRYRNMLESSGLPAMAGRSRLGLKATKPLTTSAAAADPPNYLPFNWSGTVTDLLNMRNGPGWFPMNGTIYQIAYRFDTAAAVTVQWQLAGVTVATHSPSSDSTTAMTQAYVGEDLVGTVTADAGASGLTAFVFLR